ncbi:GTP cyclohydrolase II [Paracoccaceae bacterium]|nr:GTP cyclohydrolase II [Paracoccaceae bacterium]
MLLNASEISSRLVSDLRLGLPVILYDGEQIVLAAAIETLYSEKLEKINQITNSKNFEIAITNRRAKVLNARVYNEAVTRLSIKEKIDMQLLHAIADPSKDLDYPLKGPFQSERDGNFEIASLSLSLCKKARLLPASILLKITENIRRKLVSNQISECDINYLKIKSKATTFLPTLSSAQLPIDGQKNISLTVFRELTDLTEHYAIVFGKPKNNQPVLTRVHSACFTGDLLGSEKCDCGEQFSVSMSKMKNEGNGILLYLNQEGRGIGLANKMRAYHLQSIGFDTVDANHRLGFEDDERDLEIAAKILRTFGIHDVKLMTNNPKKIELLTSQGITVKERVPLIVSINPNNEKYLKTKAKKSGHLF